MMDDALGFIPVALFKTFMYASIFAMAFGFLFWKFQAIETFLVNSYTSHRDWIVNQLARMFIEVAPQKVMRLLVGASLLFVVFALILTWPYPFLSIFVAPPLIILLFIGPRVVIQNMLQKRVGIFAVQLIEALTLMANALRSGLNIPQALQLVSEEMPNPVAQEFALVLSQQKVGTPLEEAFNLMSQRLPSDDVDIFVTSVNILKETGGNLAETFDTITKTIRERVKLEQKISAMTAQGVVQGTIMCLMPVGIGIMLYMMNPDQMVLLFTTPLGWAVVGLILFLQGIGAFAIYKIIKIKV